MAADYVDISEYEVYIIKLLNRSLSGLSIVASILVFAFYWFFKENRTLNSKFVLFFCLADIFYSMSAFFPYAGHNSEAWCAVQSFFITSFQNSTAIWSGIIGYIAFISAINKDHIQNNYKSYFTLFICLGYVIPLILGLM